METLRDYTEDTSTRIAGKNKSYWIWAMVEGKLYVYGRCFETPQEANNAAGRINVRGKQLENYHIEGLDTIDISAATQYIKGKRLENTGDLLGSTQRAKHQF